MQELKVKDMMTRGVVTVDEDASVKQAVEILADYDISGLVVTRLNGELVGVLSEIDVMKVFNEDLEKIKVKKVMHSPAITVDKEDSLRKASQLMKENNIHRLVVQQEVKGEEGVKRIPSGIISISDIIRAIAGRR